VPTIPLYSHAAHPDGGHGVTSPGGYEWWHFEARCPSDDRWVVARLSSGFPFDRSYVRQYQRYRRHPTRFPPPRPVEFVEAKLEVHRGDRLECCAVTRHDADAFTASRDRPELRIGPNTWCDGVLTMPGLNLRFCPRATGAAGATSLVGEHEFMPRSFPGGQHRWIVGSALCDVEGQLDSREFRGVGYRDHHYGTDLPAQEAKRWFHGRAIADDGSWSVAFHHVQPCDWRADAEVQLIESDDSGAASARQVERTDLTGSRPTMFLLTYPISMRLGGVLNLSRGRAIASSAFAVEVMYDAQHRGRKGKALCTMTYPQRLRWPGW
jgi:hypothetical protein